jgi:hypothetical protein
MNEPIITKEILEEIDFDFNGRDEAEFLSLINGILERRISKALVETLTDDEADKLKQLIDTDEVEKTNQWIADNVPDYRGIVEDQVDILIGDLAKQGAEITE